MRDVLTPRVSRGEAWLRGLGLFEASTSEGCEAGPEIHFGNVLF